jgi:hypothetical protein
VEQLHVSVLRREKAISHLAHGVNGLKPSAG